MKNKKILRSLRANKEEDVKRNADKKRTTPANARRAFSAIRGFPGFVWNNNTASEKESRSFFSLCWQKMKKGLDNPRIFLSLRSACTHPSAHGSSAYRRAAGGALTAVAGREKRDDKVRTGSAQRASNATRRRAER